MSVRLLQPEPLDRSVRLSALAVAVVIAMVFSAARQLTPHPAGYGTHRQLGLPECRFRRLTGWNCPTCGMTTSFTHLARGQIRAAVRASPAGVVVAVAAGMLVLPWCVTAVFTGRSLVIRHPGKAVLWLIGFCMVLSIWFWLIRMDLLRIDGAQQWRNLKGIVRNGTGAESSVESFCFCRCWPAAVSWWPPERWCSAIPSTRRPSN